MPTFREMDSHVTYGAQLRQDTGPVVLTNILSVDPPALDGLIDVWAADAEYMKAQPGFIATQLHRGTAGSGTLLNVAVWESSAALRVAFLSEAFQQRLAAYPDAATVSPHIFERVAVPGICVR
jgi:heme-degrading monooxygenase HmoA